MKHYLSTLLFALFTVATLSAAEHKQLGIDARGAVKSADEARIAAMKAADRAKLGAILSDDLHYAHSTGTVDTKASFIELVTSGKSKYLSVDYEKQEFSFPAPGIALMSGRARFQNATPEGKLDNMLSFLAVWRLEKGQWRFLAWQSCKLPPAAKP